MITETMAKEIMQSFSEAEGEEFVFDTDWNCSIVSDEERLINIHYNIELGEIQLFSIIGQLPEDDESLSEDIIRFFMLSNFMWIDSMGSIFALETDNNYIVLQKSYQYADEINENFKEVITRFDFELGYWINTFIHLPEELDDIDLDSNIDINW